MERFSGKVSLISGASSGIGYAAARRMAEEGANVAVCSRNMDHVNETVERLRSESLKAFGFYYNAEDMESVEECVASVADHFGRIDVLVNNVGGTDMRLDGPVETLDMEYFNRAMDLNLRNTLVAIRKSLPHIPSGGSIVNVASIGGITGDFRGTLYGIAKAGMINLTRYVATQCGHKGIRCNAVAPGLILTKAAINNLSPEVMEIFARQNPLPYLGNPEDVGAAVAFLASDDARYITGQTLVVDGGMTCHNPTALHLAALQS